VGIRIVCCSIDALMVSSAMTLVPSASTHWFPDIDLTASFVRASALLVLAFMLLTMLLLFVLFFLPMRPVLLALLHHLCPLPAMFYI
jgi:hypothetical protein